MMVGLDTNVLVRYLAQDDPHQSPIATNLIESFSAQEPAFISIVTLVELVWVMQGCYRASKDDILAIMQKLLRVSSFNTENPELLMKAVHLYAKTNADFADCLIVMMGNGAGCSETVTFDKKAANSCGMKLVD